MAIAIFSAFRSTVTPFLDRLISSTDRWLVDPTTGAVTGVKNPNANGPDARFVPVDITSAQLNAPTAAMLADLDATYRLNEAPYPRFQSDGTYLVPLGGTNSSEIVIPAGAMPIYQAPLTITTPDEMIIYGGIKVVNLV